MAAERKEEESFLYPSPPIEDGTAPEEEKNPPLCVVCGRRHVERS